jgi:hypothetical protein
MNLPTGPIPPFSSQPPMPIFQQMPTYFHTGPIPPLFSRPTMATHQRKPTNNFMHNQRAFASDLSVDQTIAKSKRARFKEQIRAKIGCEKKIQMLKSSDPSSSNSIKKEPIIGGKLVCYIVINCNMF